MTRRPRYRSSTTLRLSCIGSAPRTCASNTHTPIAQAFRELRSQDAPGRSTCSWPSPRSERMALTQSRFADGCGRCSTACSWWPRPIVASAFGLNFRRSTRASRKVSPMRRAWRSRAPATRKASVRRRWSGRTPTEGGATSPGCDANLKHEVCEPIDLIERRGRRVEIQFRDSRVPERLHGTPDRGLGTEGVFGDHFGVVVEESVVVAQVLAGILFGVSAEGEVRDGRKPRLLDPTGLLPRGCHPFDQGGRVLRWRASDGQSDGPVNDPAHRLVAGAPDEDWYPASVDRRWTYRWGVAVDGLTPPRFV